MDVLLAIDPGATMGWALFRGGLLVDSGACKTEIVLSWCELSKQALRAGHSKPPHPSDAWGTMLIGERPEYRGRVGENKGTPDSLITLGVSLGEVMGLYRKGFSQVEYATPMQWKGSVPKDICHRRIQKVLGPDDAPFPSNHNARDAVGLGLWKLKRYKR